MRRSSLLIALLLAIASLGLAAPAQADSWGGTLEGVVTDAVTGQPVSGISVLPWRSDVQEGANSARTDAAGHWEVSAPAGTYQVMLMDWSSRYPTQWVGGARDQSQATEYALADGGHLQLDAALLPLPTISGRITDSAGAPVVGFCPSFRLVDPDDGFGAGGACTDAQGYYSQGIEVAGTYIVQFSSYGTEFANQWYPAANVREDAKKLVITTTSGATGINAVLRPQSTITTRLTDGGKVLLQGCATAFDLAGRYVGNGCTEGTPGSVTITGLPAGTYVVQAQEQLPASHVTRYLGGEKSADKATRVKLKVGQRVTVRDLALPLGGSITGVVRDAVTGAPVSTACVSTTGILEMALVIDRNPIETGYACTDNAGRFTVRGLEAGSYPVRVGDTDGDRADLFLPSSPDSQGGQRYKVTLGKATAVSASLQPGGSISGTVSYTDGSAPMWRGVQAFSTRTNEPIGTIAWTDEAGAFRIGRLGTNDYRVALLSQLDSQPETYFPSTVHVTSGQQTTGIGITAAPPA